MAHDKASDVRWYHFGAWKLEADRSQVFPDNPGMGTPLLVHAPDGSTATLACALGEGDCDGVEIPESVYKWLESKAGLWGEAFVFPDEVQK